MWKYVLLLVVTGLTGCHAPETSAPLDRSHAPKPGPASEVKFPSYHESSLPNGLKVFVYEQHKVPLVTLHLVVKAGEAQEGNHPPLAAIAASLLTRGTGKRDVKQIADEVDFMGAQLGAEAGEDGTTLSMTVLTRYLDQGLDIFQDTVLHSVFPDPEIQFIKQQQLNELQLAKSNGKVLASEAFRREIYQNHPYGRTSLGTEQTIQAINRNELMSFYRSYFVPNNSFIVVAGDVQADAITAKLAQIFGDWKKQPVPEQKFPEPSLPSGRKVVIVEKPGAVQSVLQIGELGLPRNHPDFVKAQVANMILGGYFGSRINMNLRERHAFTYGAQGLFNGNLLLGDYSIDAQVRNQVTEPAITEVFNELKRFQEEKVSPAELDEAKNYMSGLFAIQTETASAIATRIQAMELYGLPKDFYEKYLERVQAVTVDDVLDVAKKYLHPDQMTVVVAGEAGVLADKLKVFGPVQVVDSEGKTIAVPSKPSN